MCARVFSCYSCTAERYRGSFRLQLRNGSTKYRGNVESNLGIVMRISQNSLGLIVDEYLVPILECCHFFYKSLNK